MGHIPGSRERVQEKEESAKLYRQATADATFLRNLSVINSKHQLEGTEINKLNYPLNSCATVPIVRSPSVGHHQDYASYRQKYLVMYSPFRTFEKKEEEYNKPMKLKGKFMNKWFTTNLIRKPQTTDEPNTQALSFTFSFLQCVTRFLRWRGAHAYVSKTSPVSPVS